MIGYNAGKLHTIIGCFCRQLLVTTTEHRRHAFDKIIAAVELAIVRTTNAEKSTVAHSKNAVSELLSTTGDAAFDQQFREAVLKKYKTVEAAWDVFDHLSAPRGEFSRSDFSSVLKLLGLKQSRKDKKEKKMKTKDIFKKWFELSKSKAISFADFDAFMKKSLSQASTPASTAPAEESKKKLAKLPSDCPQLPDGCEYKCACILVSRICIPNRSISTQY